MFGIDKSVWSRWEVRFLVFIVIISLVIAGGYASYLAISSTQNPADQGLLVKNGDVITVDYIGMFEDGTVFDTSIERVAENNTQYPKSLSFTPRTDYFPLSFTVGTGQMIRGFDKGVVGMAVNQTKTLTISPDMGYGQPDEAQIESRSLTEEIPIFEWFGNTTEFIEFYGITPNIGLTVKSMRYGWNMTVYEVDMLSDKVLLKNSPFHDEIITSRYGWQSRVVSIDSSENVVPGEVIPTGKIVIRHLISEEDVRTKIYNGAEERQFMISGLDIGAGTYTVDYNQEVVGRTLTFKVTVLSITPSK